MGGILGGILGGGSSPGQDAQMNAIHGSVKDYQTYRQEAAQALLNTLNQANSAYQGTNNALETVWGAPPPKQPTGLHSMGGIGPRPVQQRTTPTVGSAMGSAISGVGAHSGRTAPDDPVMTAAGAIFDPAGIFTKGIGGLF